MIEKVGLTGLNASGKGLAAGILKEFGYAYHSLSDIVREEAAARGLDHSRESLIHVGNALRQESDDAGILARMLLPRLDGRSVIDSIRAPYEIEVLRGLEGFVLLGIKADARTRFARMTARGRQGDATTYEQFEAQEQRELGNDEHSQQLHMCISMADILVDNNGTIDEFRSKIIAACGIDV